MVSDKLKQLFGNTLTYSGDIFTIAESRQITPHQIDTLVWDAVFGTNEEKLSSRWFIWELALQLGIKPASINDLYMARGRDQIMSNFSVPAMNLRGMTYDTAQCVFTVAKKLNVYAFIFELARSEMGYTGQTPSEYVSVLLGAAIKTGWRGPVFIQGDHFQTKMHTPGVPEEGEVDSLKKLILEALSAGFYNIDIDTSTLVDLGQPTEELQQKPNIFYSVELAKFVRAHEPAGITVSLGGEIGHIGGKNSTVADFEAYIKGFKAALPENMVGISKISVQTGSSHGGIVLPDGNIAPIVIDFTVLSNISKECRKRGIGGAVQHGASTLPDEFFSEFPKSETIEVHLATGFQNELFDHQMFPKEILAEMYAWVDTEKTADRDENDTIEQFHYKTRKKAWARFKKETWQIDTAIKEELFRTLAERLEFIFTQFNVAETENLVSKFINPPTIHKKIEDFTLDSVINQNVSENVSGLAD